MCVEFIVANPNSTLLFDECLSSFKTLMVFAKEGMGNLFFLSFLLFFFFFFLFEWVFLYP